MVVPIVLMVVSAVAVAIGLGFGLVLWRRRWLIADLPTSDAAHVFVGMNEVKGAVAPAGNPIVAPYTAIQCVWYRSLLEREEQNGDNRSWKTVEDVSSEAPFWICDETGHVLVRPKGAAVYASDRVRDTHAGRPTRHSSLDILAAVDEPGLLSRLFSGSTRWRTTEWVLRPDEQVYLLGHASLRSDAVALEFSPHHPVSAARQGTLFISSGDERRAARRTLWQGLGLLLLAVAGAVSLPVEWQFLQEVRRTSGDTVSSFDSSPFAPLDAARSGMVAVAILFAIGLPLVTVGRIYNRLVEVRNRAEAAWSLVDVHLRRRHDLIPQLVAVARAAAAHEAGVLEAVAAIRSGGEPPPSRTLPDTATLEQVTAVDRADRAGSGTLMALAEAYPVLRADATFAELAMQLIASDDGVAFARTFYNDAVTVMHDRRHQFPGALVARFVPMPTLALFEADLPAARPAATAAEPEPDATA